MLTWDERRNWIIGILTAAVGGFLTGYNVGYVPWAQEINPLSAFHVTGEWYAVAKILLAFVLFPLVGYTTRYLYDKPARYESAAVALLLFADAWGNILFANYDALSVAHEVATPLLAATVVTTAVCVALVFTPELRRLTRRVRARHGRTARRAALPTVAVFAVVVVSFAGGFGGVAAQSSPTTEWSHSQHTGSVQAAVVDEDTVFSVGSDGAVIATNASDGSIRWETSLEDVSYNDIAVDSNRVYVVKASSTNPDTVALDRSTGAGEWSHSLHSSAPQAVATDGSAVFSAAGEIFAVDAATGETLVETVTEWEYTYDGSTYTSTDTSKVSSNSSEYPTKLYKIEGDTPGGFVDGSGSGTATIVSTSDTAEDFHPGGSNQGILGVDSDSVYAVPEIDFQNQAASIDKTDGTVNWNTSLKYDFLGDGDVENGNLYIAHRDEGILGYNSGGVFQENDPHTAARRTVDHEPVTGRTYSGAEDDKVAATKNGEEVYNHTKHSADVLTVTAQPETVYSGDRDGNLYAVSTNISIITGITGNVFECPSADPDCTNNPYGPGVGPDALVQVRNESTGALIEEANTTASGEYTLQNITQDDIYNVEVYVGGEKRYDQDMGLSPTQGVGRNATVPMEDPALSDFSPVDGATVDTANVTLSANLSDDDFPSDEVTVEWFDSGDNKIGEGTVSADGTATTSWQINDSGNYAYYATATDKYNYTNIFVSQVRTFSVSPEAVSPWQIEPTTASPSDNSFVGTSHTHSIDLSNLNESNVRVRFYDGSGAQIGADTVSGNGTKTASVAHSVGSSGNYAWYVVAEDQDSGVTRSSSTFSYRVAGGLNFYDKETGDLIDDRTVTAEITTPGDRYELQTTTGKVNFSDLPTIPRGNFNADVRAAGYYDTSLTIFDAATRQNVYLTPEGTDEPEPGPEGDFDVAIADTNEPVTVGDMAQIDVDVTNVLGESQDGVITLYADGTIVDSLPVRLQGGETKTISLGWSPDSTQVSNNYPITVESDTDSAATNLDINAAPASDLNASVNITGTNSPVQEGNTLNVDVNVTNNNTVSESGYITGYINGTRAVASETVTVAAQSTETKTLSWNTDLNDSGSYTFRAESDVNNDTTDVTVTEDTAGVSPSERVDVIFTLTDRSGDFTPVSETTLRVQQRVNTGTNFSYQEVASGEFGAANAFQTTLTRNERYNLVVEKGDNIRDIGGFRTNVSGEFDLVVNARSYPLDEPRPWSWNTSYDEENNQIKFGYTDTANDTDVFEIDIYEYGNSSNYLFRKAVNQTLGTYEYSQVLTENESRSRWVVAFCATRNGEEVCREEVVGSGVDDIFGDAPDWLLEIFGALSILFVAGIFSTVNAKVGAIVTLSFAGLLYAVGVMSSALTGLAIAVALTIAVIYKAGDSSL